MGIGNNNIGAPRHCYSTQDYNEACGESSGGHLFQNNKYAKDQLDEFKKKYPDIEFKINNENEVVFRKKCICNNYTNWIGHYYLEWKDRLFEGHNNSESEKILHINNIYCDVVQCGNCNPSTKFTQYTYSSQDNVWKLMKIKKYCDLCNKNRVYCSYRSNQYTDWLYKSDEIQQCEDCVPTFNNDYIKLGFTPFGWKIRKIKKLSGKKHVWINLSCHVKKELQNKFGITKIDETYKCSCNGCVKK